jgi:polynucleotide 5'-kinase involved in rRNA processing
MYGTRLAQLLRAMANSIEKLDEAQLDEFIANLKRGRLTDKSLTERYVAKKKHAKVDPAALDRIMLQLNDSATREEGSILLDRLDLSRKELERLARLRDIHVSKDDNVSKIKEKLVEVIIGSRLSSRAIRGQ